MQKINKQKKEKIYIINTTILVKKLLVGKLTKVMFASCLLNLI